MKTLSTIFAVLLILPFTAGSVLGLEQGKRAAEVYEQPEQNIEEVYDENIPAQDVKTPGSEQIDINDTAIQNEKALQSPDGPSNNASQKPVKQFHGRGNESKIYGKAERLPRGLLGTWIVNGEEILVTNDTVVQEKHGKIEPGAYLEVKGALSGNTFTAYNIEVKSAKNTAPAGRGTVNKIYGTVERLPKGLLGTWIVDGEEILVTKDSFLKEKHGKVAEGAVVEIKGMRSGETFTADKIEVKNARR